MPGHTFTFITLAVCLQMRMVSGQEVQVGTTVFDLGASDAPDPWGAPGPWTVPLVTAGSSRSSMTSRRTTSTAARTTGSRSGYRANGTGIDVYECATSSMLWSSRSFDIRQPYITATTYTTSIPDLSDLYFFTATPYTTIDGFAHAKGSPIYTAGPAPWRNYYTTIVTDVFTTEARPNASLPAQPTCQFDKLGCYYAQVDATSRYPGRFANLTTVHRDRSGEWWFPPVTEVPNCTAYPPKTATRCTVGLYRACTVFASEVQLYYWPKETSTVYNSTAASINTTVPRTTVIGNLTMTSPSIYFAFSSIYATYQGVLKEWCQQGIGINRMTQFPVGTTITTGVFAMRPEDVSTLEYGRPSFNTPSISVDAATFPWPDAAVSALALRNTTDYTYWLHSFERNFGSGGWITSRLDIDDLEHPNPRAYYLAANWNRTAARSSIRPGCNAGGPNQCNTIFDDLYRAQISIPQQLFEMQPEWRTCDPLLGGLFDPPVALTAATEVATAAVTTTTSQPPTMTPATPSKPLATPTPQATALPASEAPSIATSSSVINAQVIASQDPHLSAHAEETIIPSVVQSASTHALDPVAPPQQSTAAVAASASQLVLFTTLAAPSNALQALTQQSAAPEAVFTNEGTAVTVISMSGNAVIGEKTISAGAAATIGTVIVSNVQTGIVLASPVTQADRATASALQSHQEGALAASLDSAAADPAAPVATFQGQTIVQGKTGVVVGGSISLTAGQVATVSGAIISAGTSAVVVGASTIPLLLPNNPAPTTVVPIATLEGQTLARLSTDMGAAVVLIGSTTLLPGLVTTLAGSAISVGSAVVIVGGSTIDLTPPAAQKPSAVTAGGQTIVLAPSGEGIVIGGSTTLQPGQLTTISNTVFSAGTSAVVVGQSIIALGPSKVQPPIATVGGQTIAQAASGHGVAIGSTTLLPGQVTTISGTLVSADTNAAVIGGSTIEYTTSAAHTPIATIAGQTLAQAVGTGVVVGSTTLRPGQVTTISGVIISAGTSAVVVGGSTIAYTTPVKQMPVATIAGQTIFKASSGAGLAIGSTTLLPGQFMTISGTVVSAGTSAIVIGSSTLSLSSSGTTVLAGSTSQSRPVASASSTSSLVGGSSSCHAYSIGGLSALAILITCALWL